MIDLKEKTKTLLKLASANNLLIDWDSLLLSIIPKCEDNPPNYHS